MITLRMKSILAVGFGAMIGAMLRFLILDNFKATAPWTVAFINITGSFALGFLTGFLTGRIHRDDPWRLFLGTGLMGGYTTYSTFSMDVVHQLQEKQVVSAIANVTIQTVGSIALCAVGFVLGRKLNPAPAS